MSCLHCIILVQLNSKTFLFGQIFRRPSWSLNWNILQTIKQKQIEFFGIAKPHGKEVQVAQEWNCQKERWNCRQDSRGPFTFSSISLSLKSGGWRAHNVLRWGLNCQRVTPRTHSHLAVSRWKGTSWGWHFAVRLELPGREVKLLPKTPGTHSH